MTATGAGGRVLAVDTVEGAAGKDPAEAGPGTVAAAGVVVAVADAEAGAGAGGKLRSSAADANNADDASSKAQMIAGFTPRFLGFSSLSRIRLEPQSARISALIRIGTVIDSPWNSTYRGPTRINANENQNRSALDHGR